MVLSERKKIDGKVFHLYKRGTKRGKGVLTETTIGNIKTKLMPKFNVRVKRTTAGYIYIWIRRKL